MNIALRIERYPGNTGTESSDPPGSQGKSESTVVPALGEMAMHEDYRDEKIKELTRPTDSIRAQGEEGRAGCPCRKTILRDRSRSTLRVRLPLLPSHELPARNAESTQHRLGRSEARSAIVDRRSERFGRCRGQRSGRAGAHGGRTEQNVQRLDQDDQPLARLRAGQPSAAVRRSQASRVLAQQR